VQPDLISVGDVMVDVSVESRTLRRGGDVHGQVRVRPGGAAANAAVWAAAAGAAVRLHGRIGGDFAGRLVRSALEERAVDPALTVDPGGTTGTMLVVHEAADRSMVADRGANAGLSAADLPDELTAGAVLVSGYTLYDPGSEATAIEALRRSRARWTAVDAASWPLLERYGAERFLKAAGPANLLLVNQAEARALTTLRGDEDAARALAEHFDIAVIKLGPGGALLARRGDPLLEASAPPVEEFDPTGAGDAFGGVLLASLARGSAPQAALQEACRAGAAAAASPDPWPPL
jgi:sugar/nucleoside kinase (ribokinase family)